MRRLLFAFMGTLLITSKAFGQGFTLWDETVNGPLGSHAGISTSLGLFGLGTNSIFGSAEIEQTGASWFVHEDYFHFSLSSGTQISAAFLSVDNQYLALWLGTSDYNTQLGYAPNALNGGLLSQFGIPSVGEGAYGMYLANYDFAPASSVANYRIDFVVAAVPEPGTWALLGLGGALLWSATRRRRK